MEQIDLGFGAPVLSPLRQEAQNKSSKRWLDCRAILKHNQKLLNVAIDMQHQRSKHYANGDEDEEFVARRKPEKTPFFHFCNEANYISLLVYGVSATTWKQVHPIAVAQGKTQQDFGTEDEINLHNYLVMHARVLALQGFSKDQRKAELTDIVNLLA